MASIFNRNDFIRIQPDPENIGTGRDPIWAVQAFYGQRSMTYYYSSLNDVDRIKKVLIISQLQELQVFRDQLEFTNEIKTMSEKDLLYEIDKCFEFAYEAGCMSEETFKIKVYNIYDYLDNHKPLRISDSTF